MATQNSIILSKIVVCLLSCSVMVSYAEPSHSNRYDHNKDYFDYYGDKPAHRHEKRAKHQKNSHQKRHHHTRFCKNNHYQYREQARFHREHHRRHYQPGNIGLGFFIRFLN